MTSIEIPNESDPRWEDAGAIKELNLFPLKSAGCIPLDQAIVGKYGLSDLEGHFDRSFMVVDSEGCFVTLRKYPKLVLISIKFDGVAAEFSAPGQEPIIVDLSTKGEFVKCKVWEDTTNGYDLGDEVAQWITDYVGKANKSFRILRHAGENIRVQIDVPGENGVISKDDTCLYADGYGFLLATSSSLAGLNERLVARGKNPLPDTRRFRPNIVVGGPQESFDEDNWMYLKVSDVIFKVCSPCARCQAPNIDPHTGTPSKEYEPTKTLKTFRRIKGDDLTYFGINLGIVKGVGSSICVGSRVEIIRRKHNETKFQKHVAHTLAIAAVSLIVFYYTISK